MNNMKSRNEYEQLLKSGMFWEFYPELSGEWKNDRLKWLEIQGIINKDSNWFDKLKAILDNQTKEESQAEWDEVVALDLVVPTVEEYIKNSKIMSYKEAIELAYHVKWKTNVCTQGKKCWCRTIEPEIPINYIEDGTDFEQKLYIIGMGAINKEFAEYFVELHNKTIEI